MCTIYMQINLASMQLPSSCSITHCERCFGADPQIPLGGQGRLERLLYHNQRKAADAYVEFAFRIPFIGMQVLKSIVDTPELYSNEEYAKVKESFGRQY